MLRLIRIVGLMLFLSLALFWMAFIGLNPYPSPGVTAETHLIALAMIGLAAIGAVAFFANKASLVLVIGLISFVPIGFYLLGAPSIFALIGVLDLLTLLFGILLLTPKFPQLARALRYWLKPTR